MLILQTIKAVKLVLGDKKYFFSFIFLSAAIFTVIFAIQVGSIPGNSFRYQAGILGYQDWLFFGALAVLNALFIEMEIYIARMSPERSKTPEASADMPSASRTSYGMNKKQKIDLFKSAAISGVGTSSGIVASIFGAATCSLCVSALFGFLGANSVIFLVDHKNWVTFGSIGLLTAALFITAARFNTACEACRVNI